MIIFSILKIYPNPFIDVINLFGIEGGETIIINDILGKEVFKGLESKN